MNITDEMKDAANIAMGAARGYPAKTGSPLPLGLLEALAAVAPLIEAQVREQMQKQIDGAYEERNRIVALLAAVFPSGQKPTAIEGWDADWHPCVYVDLPCGQASWHYHVSQAAMFEHVGDYAGERDGHSTEEKYRRIADYAANLSPALREQMAEDRMAGEIMRAIRRNYCLELSPIDSGAGGFYLRDICKCIRVAQSETIPALHAAMVEAGMIGGDK